MIDELKVGVVIPAYNEAASLSRLLPKIPRDLVDKVVVVNDCSTDQTSELDLVRGSRHLAGGGHVNIPWHRLLMIQVFTLLFSMLAGRRVTDATGGYQAYRLKILDDPRIDLHQPWLGRYEVETYLFAKTLLCGYRWKEVPVQITYAGGKKPYTRARPIVDWWGYFRPVLLLRLGLKR